MKTPKNKPPQPKKRPLRLEPRFDYMTGAQLSTEVIDPMTGVVIGYEDDHSQ